MTTLTNKAITGTPSLTNKPESLLTSIFLLLDTSAFLLLDTGGFLVLSDTETGFTNKALNSLSMTNKSITG